MGKDRRPVKPDHQPKQNHSDVLFRSADITLTVTEMSVFPWWTRHHIVRYDRSTDQSFITAFIVFFVVIDPIGDGPICLAVTETQDHARKLHTALESTIIASAKMMFFPLCREYTLTHFTIIEAAFKIAGGIILFLVALDMLVAKRQQH